MEADDYEETRELVAIFRGDGESGRSMFGRGDSLPPVYARLHMDGRIGVLGDRIDGHYDKCCVVADEDDADTMLEHGAAQIDLRPL